MRSLVETFLATLAAFEGTDEDCLQAMAQLRAEAWIAALSVIVETEGPRQATESLESLTQADAFLVLLARGWTPDGRGSPAPVTPTQAARKLYHRLERLLGIWMNRGSIDPGSLIRGIEAAYRYTLTQVLQLAAPKAQRDLMAIHYAFRRAIIASTLDRIAIASPPAPPKPQAPQTGARPWQPSTEHSCEADAESDQSSADDHR